MPLWTLDGQEFHSRPADKVEPLKTAYYPFNLVQIVLSNPRLLGEPLQIIGFHPIVAGGLHPPNILFVDGGGSIVLVLIQRDSSPYPVSTLLFYREMMRHLTSEVFTDCARRYFQSSSLDLARLLEKFYRDGVGLTSFPSLSSNQRIVIVGSDGAGIEVDSDAPKNWREQIDVRLIRFKGSVIRRTIVIEPELMPH